ncbi:MAG: ACP S-malonyltransferase [Nocardioides sp.]
MLAIAAPGQGAQSPGFLGPWLADARLAADLAVYSEAADLDLGHYGTEADTDVIRDTAIAQPLLVAAGLLTGSAVLAEDGGGELGSQSGRPHSDLMRPDLWTGHSVGELTVAGLSGVLSPAQAVRIVAERGRAMADASAVAATGMTAVLGGVREEVLAALDRHGLTAANDNGPGQIVAAGTIHQLAELAADPPAGCRLISLSVAGAFHTAHMASAVARLSSAVAPVQPAAPSMPIVSNRDGALVETGAEVVERIVGQVANPVRWDLCMQTLVTQGVTGLLELSPAGTLSGIARRAMPGVATFALKGPDQIPEARAFCAEHRAVRAR